ncbi:MAG: hypothetical protein ABR577_12595 [Pyrinomonadaceae bacterium]
MKAKEGNQIPAQSSDIHDDLAMEVLRELIPELFGQIDEIQYGSMPEAQWEQQMENLVDNFNLRVNEHYARKVEENAK